MYILLGEKQDKKITVIEKTVDKTMLTLYINREFSMSEVYELFEKNNLEIITVYNDDDTLNSVYTRYTEIDSFFFSALNKRYVINLKRPQTKGLEESVKECVERVDKLSQTVITMRSEINKPVSIPLIQDVSELSESKTYRNQNIVKTMTNRIKGATSMRKVEKETILRTIVLITALFNNILTMVGYNPLPFSNEEVYTAATAVFTVGAALWAWWKNNSFTQKAIEADKVLKGTK